MFSLVSVCPGGWVSLLVGVGKPGSVFLFGEQLCLVPGSFLEVGIPEGGRQVYQGVGIPGILAPPPGPDT